jgi:hypothetical protein
LDPARSASQSQQISGEPGAPSRKVLDRARQAGQCQQISG